MDVLNTHLDTIRVPEPLDKVYKDECLFSFDNGNTDTGLFISLTSFWGLGKDYVELYHRKTGHSVFLHIKREWYKVPSSSQGDGPEKKITRLAIGMEGGFDPSKENKFEFRETYTIVILPSFKSLSWPDSQFPDIINKSVKRILKAESANKLAELEALQGTWDGEVRVVSKHAKDLKQLDNGKKIPPTGWKCEKCEKTENLWLNLTDGSVLCGRRFFDGSGGNNHAIQHFSDTGYPLAVKLGTITKDGKADIFSYTEDDMVEDPYIKEHLAHWGINVATMEKTEKSMVELELELNKKTNEWAMLQESGSKLKPVYGPGYTGMINLGNSCYLNSVMQVLFTIPDFINRYVDQAGQIFEMFNINSCPADDFNIQMAKIGVGLLSGKYSIAPDESKPDFNGISPRMFKTLVGRGHPDLSTSKQQDAQEFFLHVVKLLEYNNKNRINPADCFKYKVEERVQCVSSKKVKYTYRSDNILPLSISLEAAVNKEEVSAYEERKAQLEAEGKKIDPSQVVRPRIKFISCLESFAQSELIEQYFSTAVNSRTTARKTTRIATFPDYLLIQLKKFTLREDWVPIKLDVAVEMPDVIDLSSLRATGPQPGEEEMPELTGSLPSPPPIDDLVLKQLMDLGFPVDACRRAIFFTKNTGVENATAWLFKHISDSDFMEPFMPPGLEGLSKVTSDFVPDRDAVDAIKGMGFAEQQAVKALKATNNELERAVDWIFSNQEEVEDTTIASNESSEYRDGGSQYQLVAFISHMGTSAAAGHYVAHIYKDGHWVIFNDNKVALSENLPKELGYLYLYKRF
ncbi:ubiquitin carboxyl-terminal hydrolase 5 [Agrilus planipennis]|uniref:Ubiquitin carboxyl-terminal hydrolase n=1 Tax=Agrilus planipennis TaxID=224129 RepID=A0A1W4WWK6_AGRPL|nr:ubiquitin carboxyl-terminal hydrolase 5 [Agrilus planipennis]